MLESLHCLPYHLLMFNPKHGLSKTPRIKSAMFHDAN